MPTSVKHVQVWRTEVAHTPGQLAAVLGPLALAGADLQVVMAYRLPGEPARAAVEVYPVSGKKRVAAAQGRGLAASPMPVLRVEGDNKPGLGALFATALADAGVNVAFLVVQVMGRKFTAVYGFETEGDARTATALIRKAGALGRRKSAKKR